MGVGSYLKEADQTPREELTWQRSAAKFEGLPGGRLQSAPFLAEEFQSWYRWGLNARVPSAPELDGFLSFKKCYLTLAVGLFTLGPRGGEGGCVRTPKGPQKCTQ